MRDLEILAETIVAEIKLDRKKIFFVLSYCHPNLSSIELDEYVKSLERIYECINQENPAVTILTGDFNAMSPLFWENDTENRGGRVFNNCTHILMYGSNVYNDITSESILRETIHLIKNSGRFEKLGAFP